MYDIINISGNPLYAECIHSLDEKCFPDDNWSLSMIEKELRQNCGIYFICMHNEIPVGYLNANTILDEIELNRICVLPQFRRHGIADKLMNTLFSYSEDNDFSVIHLEVRSKNWGAVALYKKHNFKADTLRKGYYHNPSDDAVLMSKII